MIKEREKHLEEVLGENSSSITKEDDVTYDYG